MEQLGTFKSTWRSFLERNRLTFKAIFIFILTLILLIPQELIEDLINERNDRKEGVMYEIASKWGTDQTVTGPILVVPYYMVEIERVEEDDKIIEKTHRVYHKAYFLPEYFNVEGILNPQIRKRGIYEAVLYDAKLNLSGTFSLPDLSFLNVSKSQILWEDIALVFDVDDKQGVQGIPALSFDGDSLQFQPGFSGIDELYGAMYTPIGFADHMEYGARREQEKPVEFSMNLALKGSQRFRVDPIGKKTEVTLRSHWADPKFDGAFLPEDHAISEDGFSSYWDVSYINRAYPQQWIDYQSNIHSSNFGVDLILSVNPHLKVYRSAKYALLIIILTFVMFFLIEWYTKQSLHPLVYLLVGAALVLYYSLLLSFSEHFGFEKAYALSSLMTIGLISSYSLAVFVRRLFSWVLFSGLAGVYAFLFVTLESQDHALLLGSLGLFVILALLMFLTRGAIQKKRT
jgi:inner membrane protein